MNFLAHALLTPPDDDHLLVGNMIADWVKGRARKELSPSIQRGMLLHRHIDTFTDTHHVVARAAELLSDKWGRYSTVLIDIFFDHVLATHWPTYSEVPFDQFVRTTYATLNRHRNILTGRTLLGLHYMTTDDWLSTYATPEGIRLTLSRVTQRLRHDIDLAPATDDLFANEHPIAAAFEIFFPQLQQHLHHPPSSEI